MNDYIASKFARDVANDENNNISYEDALQIIENEIDGLGEVPNYIMNGDIVAFRCAWSVYNDNELLCNYYYLLDEEYEDEYEKLEAIKEKLIENTQVLDVNNGTAVAEF